MSDVDQMRALFDRFGIGYEVEERDAVHIPDRLPAKAPLTAVMVSEGIGYTGFYAAFYFDAAGAFVGYGVWE